jgi:murein DD-endopeptidase MepM/ murein hydrolase activator NlpD
LLSLAVLVFCVTLLLTSGRRAPAAQPAAPAPGKPATGQATPAKPTTPGASQPAPKPTPQPAVKPDPATAPDPNLEKTAAAIRDSSAAVGHGRRQHALLLAGNGKGLWDQFSEPGRAAAGGFGKFEKAFKEGTEEFGDFQYCLRDGGRRQEGRILYNAYCRYSKAPVPLVVRIAFDPDGKISGFSVRNEARPYDSKFENYQPKTELRLPVRGEWLVTAGGRTMEQNYHAVLPDERFALDFAVVKDGNRAVSGGGANDYYYSYGQPVVAPAAGKIAWAADGVADNAPGKTNLNKPYGNALVIDHGNGEFSVLSCLKRWSVFVRVGQDVASGDTLALCGNSGASGEPHVQYQLQNGPKPQAADCLPAVFADYVADDQPVTRGELVSGQRVRRGD